MGGQAGRICLLLSGLTRPIEVGFPFPAPFLESSEQAGSFWDISWLCLRIMEASKLHLKAKFGHIFKKARTKILERRRGDRLADCFCSFENCLAVVLLMFGSGWSGVLFISKHLPLSSLILPELSTAILVLFSSEYS